MADLLTELAVLMATHRPFALVFRNGLRMHDWLEATFADDPRTRLALLEHVRTCSLVPAGSAVLIDVRAFRAHHSDAARLYELAKAQVTEREIV